MSGIFRWVILAVTLLILVAVVAYTKSSINLPGPPGKVQPPTDRQPPSKVIEAPDVTVINVLPASYDAQITAFGAAHAQYELNLKSQITGQVISISDKFNSGLRLNKNDELLKLEDSDYRSAIANANADVADAKLKLLQAKREEVQAKSEWTAIGLKGNPASKLVLHEPQLAFAKAVLLKAEANLNSAQRDQNNTQIRAPFDALVAERLVSPGDYVQPGTEVAKLYSSKRVEIDLALPASDWENLPEVQILTQGNWPVQLFSVEDKHKSWQGHVIRLEQHLDETTRQRTLIIAVDNPFEQIPTLLLGTFLQVKIKGRRTDGLWKLPNSALSQRGDIWYVKDDKTIDSFVSKIRFSDTSSIYIKVPDELMSRSQQVLVSPLNSYLQGMLVTPVEQEAQAGPTK